MTLLHEGGRVVASKARGEEHGTQDKRDLGLGPGVSAFLLGADLASLSSASVAGQRISQPRCHRDLRMHYVFDVLAKCWLVGNTRHYSFYSF